MKVVHLDTETEWRGGQRQLLHLARGLRERNAEVLVVAPPESPLIHACHEGGIPCRELPARGEFDPLAAVRLRNLLKQESPDILHMHTGHAVGLGFWAWPFPGGLHKVISRRVDFPIGRGPGRLKYVLGISRILCVSEGIREVMLDCGIEEHLATTVYSGIDLERFEGPHSPGRIREELGLPPDPPIILNVAALVDHKGQRYLLEAIPSVLERLPRAHFAIAGDGPLREELESLAHALEIEDAVHFLGHRGDVPNLLAAADLFVMASHLEGLCTSILDAMAMSRAVVATRTGGIPEAVEEGETGTLVPPRDPAALAEAIVAMLRDEEKRRQYGENGRRRVEACFTVGNMVESTLRIYEELLKS